MILARCSQKSLSEADGDREVRHSIHRGKRPGRNAIRSRGLLPAQRNTIQRWDSRRCCTSSSQRYPLRAPLNQHPAVADQDTSPGPRPGFDAMSCPAGQPRPWRLGEALTICGWYHPCSLIEAFSLSPAGSVPHAPRGNKTPRERLPTNIHRGQRDNRYDSPTSKYELRLPGQNGGKSEERAWQRGWGCGKMG